MKQGIRAENIIRYLDSAAHPCTRKRSEDKKLGRKCSEEGGSAVPVNVRSQLEVWESSRSRISFQRATLFEWDVGEWSLTTFETAKTHAKDIGCFLWASPCASGRKLLLAVEADGAPRLR